jgi:hypothetical protein
LTIFIALGYDLNYLYKDSDEEEEYGVRPEYERELELTNRFNK